MWVIKLGGSLLRDPRLRGGLQLLATLGGGRVTIVPGGGPFADQVRDAQAHWAFDDVAAHNMAVLAMAQTAQLMHALEPRLPLVRHEAEIRDSLHAGRPALWLPLPLLRDAPDELTTWDVSSDSLALWLARRLNAERLVLVKACAVDAGAGLAELGAAGVLDRRFAAWAESAAFPIEVIGVDEVGRIAQGLLGGADCAAAVVDAGVRRARAAPPPRPRTAAPARRRPGA
ncbi:amino acid kinase family protein [Piscinibacter sakaiensis]|uniref:Delta 1-pyrroline-5-carboxylate synthetase n=1 Tax=Piscinibacter sakaiensis TaxID=1547922 RepID=A0A0K8P500_PISS1|nr:aspartate kinase [Piscinibacter sakaiensis]GAP37722.1 delta 1-pyrroline-5-carboxylate synthetase [Piscinibacter sakaiensis]